MTTALIISLFFLAFAIFKAMDYKLERDSNQRMLDETDKDRDFWRKMYDQSEKNYLKLHKLNEKSGRSVVAKKPAKSVKSMKPLAKRKHSKKPKREQR